MIDEVVLYAYFEFFLVHLAGVMPCEVWVDQGAYKGVPFQALVLGVAQVRSTHSHQPACCPSVSVAYRCGQSLHFFQTGMCDWLGMQLITNVFHHLHAPIMIG